MSIDVKDTTIEGYIDRFGLTTVLEHIEGICHEKAEHIATNYQDASGAKVWAKHAMLMGITIEKMRRVK